MCAFEYHNPATRGVECTFGGHLGMVLIPGGTFVPSPEQEKKGLTADLLEDWVPSFLKKTPLPVRRRLLEAAGQPVDEGIIAATAHLEEFGGGLGRREQENLEKVLQTTETGKNTDANTRLVVVDEASGLAEGLEIRTAADVEDEPEAQEKATETVPLAKEPVVDIPTPPVPPEIPDIAKMKHILETAEPADSSSFANSMQKIADAASSSAPTRRRNRYRRK